MHRDGSLVVTDSHRLYTATDAYEGEEKNIDPKTGAEVEGNYPDTSRLIPDPLSASMSVKIDVNTAAKAVKLIEQAGNVDKASDLIVISTNQKTGESTFATHERSLVQARYVAAEGDDPCEVNITANAKYVAEALALLKDAGYTEAKFNYFGNLRPFTFTAGNVTTLILPVRTP